MTVERILTPAEAIGITAEWFERKIDDMVADTGLPRALIIHALALAICKMAYARKISREDVVALIDAAYDDATGVQ